MLRKRLGISLISFAFLTAGLGMVTKAFAEPYPNSIKSIKSEHIADGEVKNQDIGADAVTTDKIMDGTILDEDINANADINGSKLLDNSVPAAKLIDGSGSGLDADFLDGRNSGSGAGNIPVNNGVLNTTLNADMVDSYHAGNASGQVPVSNGAVNTNLNADLLDGLNSGNASGQVPVSNTLKNVDLNADLLDGQHATDLQTAWRNYTDSQINTHAAIPDVHHIKTIDFADLTAGSATDAQVDDNITAGDAHTVDGQHAASYASGWFAVVGTTTYSIDTDDSGSTGLFGTGAVTNFANNVNVQVDIFWCLNDPAVNQPGTAANPVSEVGIVISGGFYGGQAENIQFDGPGAITLDVETGLGVSFSVIPPAANFVGYYNVVITQLAP